MFNSPERSYINRTRSPGNQSGSPSFYKVGLDHHRSPGSRLQGIPFYQYQSYVSPKASDQYSNAADSINSDSGSLRGMSPPGQDFASNISHISQTSISNRKDLHGIKKHTDLIVNLRTQLCNLKSEISKLMTKQELEKVSSRIVEKSKCESRDGQSKETKKDNNDDENTLSDIRDQSVSLRDKAKKFRWNDSGVEERLRYIEMENDVLRQKLKSMETRYTGKKAELKEENTLLKSKLKSLENILQINEKDMYTYKQHIERQLQMIKCKLSAKQVQQNVCSLVRQNPETLKNSERGKLEIELLVQQLKIQNQQLRKSVQVAELAHQRDLEDLRSEIEEQRMKKESAAKEAALKNEELEYLRKQFDGIAKNYAEKQAAFDENIVTLKEYQQAIKQLQSQHVELQREAEAQKDALWNQEQIFEQFEILKNELQELKQTLANKELEVEILNENNSYLKAQLTGKAAQGTNRSSISISSQTHVAEGDTCLVTIDEEEIEDNLIEELRKMQEARQTLLKRQNQLEESIQDKNELISEQETLINNLQRRISQIEESNIIMTQQLHSKDDEIEHIKNFVRSIEQQLAYEQERQRRIVSQYEEKLEKQAADFEHRLGANRQELQQKEIASPRSSRSCLENFFSSPVSRDSFIIDSFDEVFSLKQTLSQKEQEIMTLKEKIVSLTSLHKNLTSEFDMLKLRSESEKKNILSSFQIELQNLRNELVVEKRTGQSLSLKLKYLAEQSKRKDSFMQSHLLGKKLTTPEELQSFFDAFRLQLPVQGVREYLLKEHQLTQKLQLENTQLKSKLRLLQQLQQSKFD